MLSFFRIFSFIFISVLLFTSTASFSQQVQINEQELDYEIFDIVLKEKTLYQSADFYRTKNGNILAPLLLIKDLLEAELAYDAETQTFTGNIGNIKINTTLSQLASSVEVPTYWSSTELGYYFDVKLISKLLQSELTINYSTLSLIIVPEDKALQFPIEIRLLRESRNIGGLPTNVVNYNFLVEDQYRLFTPPKGQVSISSTKNEFNTITTGNLNLYGDALYHATNLILNSNTTSNDITGRLTFKRDQVSPNKKILGLLNNYSFGDVSNTVTRFGVPVSGLGFSASTVDKRFNNYYGKSTIEEDVPVGWEVELYRYNFLIAIEESTANGKVLFEDIDVNFGTNRFVLKLYGPYGETETRNVDIVVGNQIIKQGHVDFSINYVDQTKSIFNNSSSDISSEFIPTLYTQTNLGLGNQTSIGLGYLRQEFSGIDNDREEQIILSLSKSLPSSLLDISAIFNDADEYNYNINLVGAIGSQSSYRFTGLSRKDEVNESNAITAYYFTRFNKMSVAFSSDIQQDQNLNEVIDTQNHQLTLAIPVWGANISNTLEYTNSDRNTTTSPYTEVWEGRLSVTRNITSLINTRFSLNYLLEQVEQQKAGVQSANFNMNWHTLNQMNGSFDIQLSNPGTDIEEYSVNSRLAWKTKKITFANDVTYSSINKWSFGISINFSLDYDYYKNKMNLQSEYSAQSSTLDLFTFQDRNKSGRFDEFDSALSGVKFGPATYWEDSPTNKNGYTYLPNNQINRPFKITYTTTETKSDLLSPVYSDVYFYTHAGGVTSFDVPFNYTSYLDGFIVNLSDKSVPPNIPLELLTMNNKVLKSFNSDFNSSYSLEKLWPGKYKIRIVPEYLEKLGVVSQPAEHLINVKTGTNFVEVPDFELINVEEHLEAQSQLAHNQFYTIQFGAYDSRQFCALRVKTLKQSGFTNAFYVIEDNECKVFVGEFKSELNADEFKETIPESIIVDGFTVKYREGEEIYSVEVEAYSIQLAAVSKNGQCDASAFSDIANKLDNIYLLATGAYCKLYLGDYTSAINARNALEALPEELKKGAFLVKH